MGFWSPRVCCGFDTCGWPGAGLSSTLVRLAERALTERAFVHLQSGPVADTLAGCTGTPRHPHPGGFWERYSWPQGGGTGTGAARPRSGQGTDPPGLNRRGGRASEAPEVGPPDRFHDALLLPAAV